MVGAALTLFLLTPAAFSQSQDQTTRLIFLGADAAEGLPGPVDDALSILALPELPAAGQADIDVLGALLRSNPVSSFVSNDDQTRVDTGDFYMVADLGLTGGTEGTGVSIGGETVPMASLADRLGGLIGAFNPGARQIAFYRISDPEGRFPGSLAQIRSAVGKAGFAMSVVMVGGTGCDEPRVPFHYAVLDGVPDRTPFGDSDDVVAAGEALSWLTSALSRASTREGACAVSYSLILRDDENDARPVVRVTPGLIPEMDSAVYRETFEALFLMSSEDPAPIRAYLDSCVYCPSEAELDNRLRDIGERELALKLERDVWETIREDKDPSRFVVYLENCTLCAFREEAEARVSFFRAAETASAEEAESFEALASARDLGGLRDWVETCVVCEKAEEVRAIIGEIEADGRVQEEEAALTAAMTPPNPQKLTRWIETCEICVGLGKAEAALAGIDEDRVAAEPCLKAAGLPQQGGPRLLSSIDTIAARRICKAASPGLEGNPIANVALGRVAQAEGDGAAANRAYALGMQAGVPAAFGLAAHSAYAPLAGAADYELAESLAQKGRAFDDWLSAEVLTVLYSRELIEGKGPEDALEVALEQAEAGNPVGQFFAGYFFLSGVGTDPDATTAERWLTAAVEQGYLHANSFLAELYETGKDTVEPRPDRAAELLWAALSKGDPTALDRLTNQIAERSPDVVREVQARLRDAGAFAGRIDGLAGPQTVSAVQSFVN